MPMTPTLTLAYLAAFGLATARITALVVFDDIVEPIRHRLFQFSPPYDDLERGHNYQSIDRVDGYIRKRVVPRKPGWLGRLVSCTHCVGVWVAAAIYAAAFYFPEIGMPVVLVAAYAQVAEIAIKVSR